MSINTKLLKILKQINKLTYKKRSIIVKPGKHSFKCILYAGFFRALNYSLEIYKNNTPPNESIFIMPIFFLFSWKLLSRPDTLHQYDPSFL